MAVNPRPTELGPGARLGHFKILEFVGAGGMGVVFKAQDMRLERPVALKVLSRELFQDEMARSRFLREAQIAAAISHPNVATVHEIDAEDETLFIAMEWVPGFDLKELLTPGPLPMKRVLSIGKQVCSALQAAHDLGVVHRDVKSSNIRITPEGDTKVLDFGLAKAVADTEQVILSQEGITRDKNLQDIAEPFRPAKRRSTALGVAVGTPYYMSPEQASGEKVDTRSDIFSLGVVLYEAASGQLPFEGGTDAEILESIRTKDPTPLPMDQRNIPSAFSDVIRTCLEKKPERRYPSVAALHQDLSRLENKVFAKWYAGIKLFLAYVLRRKLATALVLLVFALGIWQWFPFQTLQVPAGTAVVLADIDNRTLDDGLDAVQTLFETQLQQSTHMRVLGKAAVGATLERMVLPADQPMDVETAREVAWRDGVPLVLAGSLFRVGTRYVLAIRLDRVEDSPAPTATWSRDFRASDRNGLYESVDQASRWVRATIGETAEELAATQIPAQETTTPSWEALSLFARAEQAWYGGGTEDARLLLKQAVSLDPDFAMAWARLADISNLDNLREAFSYYQKALDAMTRRRVTQYEELRIKALYAIDSHDYHNAEKLFRTFSLTYPNDYSALSMYAYCLNASGRAEEALLKFLEAEPLRPEAYQALVNVAQTYLMLGRLEDVESYVDRLRDLESHVWADELQSAVAFLRRDYDEAVKVISGLTRSQDLGGQSRGYSVLASLLGEMGKYQEAVAALEEGLAIDDQLGEPNARADKLLALAYIYYKTQNWQACRDACLQATELEASSNRLLRAGTLLARCGYTGEAQQVRSKMEEWSDEIIFAKSKLRVSGEILLARGNADDARQHFEQARAIQGLALESEYLARALTRTEDLEQAHKLYGAMSSAPGRLWRYQSLIRFPGFWANTLLEYAELSQSLGKAEESRTALASYMDLRAEADPGFEDVARARDLLKRLDR